MKTEYVCPYCRGYLMANTKLILTGRKADGKRGLILFNPKLGEYDVIKHESFEIKEGEQVEILCPLCHANLTDQTISNSLAKIIMIDEKGQESSIYFSEIYGMKCTYKIHEGSVESFGEDSENYSNYWGAAPRY